MADAQIAALRAEVDEWKQKYAQLEKDHETTMAEKDEVEPTPHSAPATITSPDTHANLLSLTPACLHTYAYADVVVPLCD